MMVGVPTRSGNRLCFPWATADTSMYRAYQWNILEAFRAQSIYLYVNPRKSVFLGYELKLLISTAGGRFHFITVQGRHLFKETTFIVSTLPRAWLEPPRSLRSLWGLKAHGTALSFVPPETFAPARPVRRRLRSCPRKASARIDPGRQQ